MFDRHAYYLAHRSEILERCRENSKRYRLSHYEAELKRCKCYYESHRSEILERKRSERSKGLGV